MNREPEWVSRLFPAIRRIYQQVLEGASTRETPTFIFQEGVNFHSAALRCAAPVANGEGSIVLTSPYIICYAFACELYLKSMLVDNGVALPIKEHRLDKLCDKLSQSFRESLQLDYAKSTGRPPNLMSQDITGLSNTFVRWRYRFEASVLDIEVQHLVNIARTLYTTIKRVRPEWETSRRINDEILEEPIEDVIFIHQDENGRTIRAVRVDWKPKPWYTVRIL